ncbi:MAG: M48 family metallopeptidase [Blastocatellia bacterium]|nr:M48 family metallopeptidase [Blastocatellia bacterium]
MLKLQRSRIVTTIVGCLLLTLFSPSLEALATEKDKKEKEQIPKNFAELKTYSNNLYDTDSAFHQDVDVLYLQLQQKHGEEAFKINTLDLYGQQTLLTGDQKEMPPMLYDNPLVQDYVNRVGQSLVPASSANVFAFKVLLNPVPEAKTLSTGTIYISTGLLAFVDNEAQLAYALAHEIAHVEKEHWKQDILIHQAQLRINEKQTEKRNDINFWSTIGGALIPGVGSNGLAQFAIRNVLPSVLKLKIPNSTVSWDKLQEDEADRVALDYLLNRNYDPREVPKFYARMKQRTLSDRRAKLGFMAQAQRITERGLEIERFLSSNNKLGQSLVAGSITLSELANRPTPQYQHYKEKELNPSQNAPERAAAANQALAGNLSLELKTKLDTGELVGSGPEFVAVMAELKRDNGYRALQFDMFQTARDSLKESLEIRSNDPLTHYYYGLVLKLNGRSAFDKNQAVQEFSAAIELDQRGMLPEARLHKAIGLMETPNEVNNAEIVTLLKKYTELYQRDNGGAVPKNMRILYGYMQEVGDLQWFAPPVGIVSTKNVEPITVVEPPPPPDTTPKPVAPPPTRPGRSKPRRS